MCFSITVAVVFLIVFHLVQLVAHWVMCLQDAPPGTVNTPFGAASDGSISANATAADSEHDWIVVNDTTPGVSPMPRRFLVRSLATILKAFALVHGSLMHASVYKRTSC
jgi:hypothetical protein